MSQYSIKDLEQLSGIKAHTIRIWEKRYGVLEPDRTDTNIRYYSDEQLRKLLNISLMLGFGHRISKVSTWTEDQLQQEIQRALRNTEQIEEQAVADKINGLIMAMIELDETKFSDIYNGSVKKRGFEKTMTEVVYPFLERVGIMWSINEINPAEEHLITHLVRQKVIANIDALKPAEHPNPKKLVLFLPENEFHELGLLLANYIAKANGHRTYYLGQHVPLQDVVSVIKSVQPDYMVTFSVTALQKEGLSAYAETLCKEAGDAKLLISGRTSLFGDVELPHNAQHLQSMDALSELLR